MSSQTPVEYALDDWRSVVSIVDLHPPVRQQIQLSRQDHLLHSGPALEHIVESRIETAIQELIAEGYRRDEVVVHQEFDELTLSYNYVITANRASPIQVPYTIGETLMEENTTQDLVSMVIEDDSSLVLPEVFPHPDEVRNMLLDAVQECLGNNILTTLHRNVGDTLGEENKNIFDESIFYKEIALSGSLELFAGKMPVQQVVGKILHDDEVMSLFINDSNNCIINNNSMQNTFVTIEDSHLVISHNMPENRLLHRYLRLFRDHVNIDTNTRSEDGITSISWSLPITEDLSTVEDFTSNLSSILSTYYKLLTRFPTCQTYQNDLPTFRTS